MPDDAEVRGVVLGTPGALIAGWAKLGVNGKRNVLGASVTILTDDGHEVTLERLEEATLGPVLRRTAEWQAHELDALTALCLDEAPAPDVEVEVIAARICGGERIVALGTVVERAFATESPSADGAFRTAAETRVAVLKPSFVATGVNAVEELAQLIEASAKTLKSTTLPAPAKPLTVTEPIPVAKPTQPPGVHDRVAGTLTPWFALAWLAAAGVLVMMFPSRAALVLVAGGVGAGLPLAFGVGRMPPFRLLPPGLRKPANPSSVAFLSLGAATVMAALWSTTASRSRKASEREVAPEIRETSLICGGLTAGALGWCVTATRRRRRLLNLIERAAPHPQPLVDGVWGATDGTLSFHAAGAPLVGDVPHAVTDGARVTGTGMQNSKGHWSGQVTTKLQGAVPELEITHASGTTIVATDGGLWWSSIYYDRSTPDSRITDRVDVIPAGAQVRVVGRAKNGVLAKGGAESLLVFAVGAGGDVVGGLRHLRRREQVSLGLASVGVVAIAAGLVVSYVG